ncbi:hypothetical protein [Companilactobacillus sp.]|jgi:hypothetical protein|uniref:hypothetical protein n=1 Tax=Companilactobacillus sp. TaxID=2767905 RepID=UPI0025BB23C2|nr:hypothetical protein [Companilactobacillus sp.]MCH4008581.1 hypothetical protein [Companilactobacillus sp.]MCH4051240.1 hypothetical protein [Companilactobacillus sp.]MCH4076524.1 hypothetical protein [Companilactobacillus sp.]MCH4125099.1 hypothetical protein [Companilactobacillus sp.]MCH4131640.1 hypothetical protein [Companilactobacillus sp.]
MKKSLIYLISSSVVAAGLLFFANPMSASAAGVATTPGDISVTHLYTNEGKLISNRGLSANTDWAVGQVISVDKTTLLQVSTNEYVKASDVTYPSHPKTVNTPVTNVGNPNVTVSTAYQTTPVFDDTTGNVSSYINHGESYKVGRIIKNASGVTFYQVSAHGWVVDGLITVSGTPESVELSPNFNPVNSYMGTTPDSIRQLISEYNSVNTRVLNAIPDNLLTTEYTISNYAGKDPSGTYMRLKAYYPNL